jgi:hypothetical protein
LIRLKDRFVKKGSNAQYLDDVDEFFSRDPLLYRKANEQGFSDYSIIGSEFGNGGFAPRAVAIHIVYFEGDTLRVHHFVSDTNVDITDPAGKYAEALKKLITWEQDNPQTTLAFQIFKDQYRQGLFPGLPTIKRLSLMHHIELVDTWLNTR